MSLTPAEVERKVRQLDNDMQSVYEMLSAIQGTQTRHTNRLLELDVKLTGHDTRFDAHDARFDAVDQKLDTVLELLRAG